MIAMEDFMMRDGWFWVCVEWMEWLNLLGVVVIGRDRKHYLSRPLLRLADAIVRYHGVGLAVMSPSGEH
jgi:hypothetical protein